MSDKDKLADMIRGKVEEILEVGLIRLNVAIRGGHIRESDLICIKEIKEMDEYIIVRLKGALDASTIPGAREQKKSQGERFDKHIIIDFYGRIFK